MIYFTKLWIVVGKGNEGIICKTADVSLVFNNLKVEKYILKRSRYSNADFFEIQGIAGGNFGIPSAVVEFC